jgi:hypothetical protein
MKIEQRFQSLDIQNSLFIIQYSLMVVKLFKNLYLIDFQEATKY